MADPLDLVGTAEIAEMYGVSPQRACQIRNNPAFPKPVAVLRCGPIWLRSEVHLFGRNRRTTPGPVPGQGGDKEGTE